MSEKLFERRAVLTRNPSTIPECYAHPWGEGSKGHEVCGKCKILDICKAAKNIPQTSYIDFHEISHKVENGQCQGNESFHCPQSEAFVFHDEKDTSRTYSHDEILNLLSYIFGLTPREFYFIQAKILFPSMTLQQIANPLGQTRAAISKRFNEMVKTRPEMFSILRIRRTSATQKPA